MVFRFGPLKSEPGKLNMHDMSWKIIKRLIIIPFGWPYAYERHYMSFYQENDTEEEPISDNSQPESSNSPPAIDEIEKQLKCLDFSEISDMVFRGL